MKTAIIIGAGPAKGGQILTGWLVTGIEQSDSRRVIAVCATHCDTGETRRFDGDYFFSTMPVQELIEAFQPRCTNTTTRITPC